MVKCKISEVALSPSRFRLNPNRIFALTAVAFAATGCVAAQDIVVDKQSYSGYSCPQLEQELAKLGAVTSKADKDQNMGSGTQVAATILGGSVINYANMKNAQNNERKAKEQLANIYSIWDEKHCSEWLYQRNSGRG